MDGEVTRWPDEKRIEAVLGYITLGKMAKVRDLTGIPLTTLWSWKQSSPWWGDLEKQLRAERNNEQASALGGIVEKAMAAIQERIEGGDYIYNPRSGDITRVPVSAAALNKIASTLLDRRLTLEKESKYKPEEEESEDRLEQQLDKLARSFKAFVAYKQRKEKVIEGDYNAVHDQREAGLQEGTEVGAYPQAQSGKGQSAA